MTTKQILASLAEIKFILYCISFRCNSFSLKRAHISRSSYASKSVFRNQFWSDAEHFFAWCYFSSGTSDLIWNWYLWYAIILIGKINTWSTHLHIPSLVFFLSIQMSRRKNFIIYFRVRVLTIFVWNSNRIVVVSPNVSDTVLLSPGNFPRKNTFAYQQASIVRMIAFGNVPFVRSPHLVA